MKFIRFSSHSFRILLVAAAAISLSHPLNAEPSAASASKPGVVSHIKIVSDQVEDVSSLEAWKQSFIEDGMSDAQKAMAVWESVLKFQFQDEPPHEYLQSEGTVLDPIKGMNVYGYSFCSVASAQAQCLARAAGLQARGWTVHHHVVPEFFFDGAWRMLDPSLITRG